MINSQPFFSIVIPTFNEEKYLPKLLKDLSLQTTQDFEVIVVDCQSKDKTVNKAQTFISKIPLKILTSPIANVSLQRNLGGQAAIGQWIIFMDADNKLPAYFLDGIKYQLAKNPKVAIFTTWIKSESRSAYATSIARIINIFFEISKSTSQQAAVGAMIGCKQEVLKKTQFDQSQQVCEDYHFVRTVVKKGYKFAVFKEPKYYFSFRRINKEGPVKMMISATLVRLRDLQGGDFSQHNFGYVMKGGKYYEPIEKNVLADFYRLLQKASKKQLMQIKDLLTAPLTSD